MNAKVTVHTLLNGARIKSGMPFPLSARVAAVPVKVCVEDPAKQHKSQSGLKTATEFPLASD